MTRDRRPASFLFLAGWDGKPVSARRAAIIRAESTRAEGERRANLYAANNWADLPGDLQNTLLDASGTWSEQTPRQSYRMATPYRMADIIRQLDPFQPFHDRS